MHHRRHQHRHQRDGKRPAAGASDQQVDQRIEQTAVTHDAEEQDRKEKQRRGGRYGQEPAFDELADLLRRETGYQADGNRDSTERYHRTDAAQQNQDNDAQHHDETQHRDHWSCLVLFLLFGLSGWLYLRQGDGSGRRMDNSR